MSTDAQNGKVFKHFPELPPELRMMVVDEMEQVDRLKFSFVSKSCNAEAKASGYYIYGLELFGFGEKDWRIYVVHGKYETSEERKHGYTVDIKEDSGKKFVKCTSLKGKPLWKKELEQSTDVSQYAMEYFKDLLRPRQHAIRKLVICGKLFANFDFGIRCLKSIQVLGIEGNADIRHFFSKIPHHLMRLEGCRRNNMPFILDCEEFYQVQKLDLHDLRLTNQQFRKLSATHVHMRIGDLTERNIADFIRSWQNETIRSKSGEYRWVLDNRNFVKSNLKRLLGICEPRRDHFFSLTRAFGNPTHTIQHHFDDGKVAQLSEMINENILKFSWGDKATQQ